MMAELKTILELAKHAVKGTTPDPTKYALNDVKGALADECHKLIPNYNAYLSNAPSLFAIIQVMADEYVPVKVLEALGAFAEIITVPQGTKIQFKKDVGKNRAKSFVTKVGLAGSYESFRLDTEVIDMTPTAYGGSAHVSVERMMDGWEAIEKNLQIILEGLVDCVYKEVQTALIAAFSNTARPANNKVSVNAWDAGKMVALCNTVKRYGAGCAIFATDDFVSGMGADAIGGAKSPAYSVQDLEDIRTIGHVQIFRGVPVVILPQSWTDDSNTKTVMNPQYAYVMPTDTKVVKIGFEGDSIVDDYKNKDMSREIQVYKKFGVAILSQNNWGIYKNTGITDTYT